jgi:phenylacetic acid degradation operon negative regulatory protein
MPVAKCPGVASQPNWCYDRNTNLARFAGCGCQTLRMHPPIGPSLQLVLLLSEALADASLMVVNAAWERWMGPQRFQRKLAQFSKRGWLQSRVANSVDERVVRLTASGRLVALGGRDPEACWRRAWDGTWRLALFDIPEERLALRARLRRRLCALGFGYLQNSVWVSPDTAEALSAAMRDSRTNVESFMLMEARPGGGETDAEIVEGGWDFPRINHNYEVHLSVLSDVPRRGAALETRRNWFATEWKAWERAMRSDPLLPEVLLPKRYLGREAWERRWQVLQRELGAA